MFALPAFQVIGSTRSFDVSIYILEFVRSPLWPLLSTTVVMAEHTYRRDTIAVIGLDFNVENPMHAELGTDGDDTSGASLGAQVLANYELTCLHPGSTVFREEPVPRSELERRFDSFNVKTYHAFIDMRQCGQHDAPRSGLDINAILYGYYVRLTCQTQFVEAVLDPRSR